MSASRRCTYCGEWCTTSTPSPDALLRPFYCDLHRAKTAGELIVELQKLPADAIVLLATDSWYAHVGEIVAPDEHQQNVQTPTIYPGREFDSREL